MRLGFRESAMDLFLAAAATAVVTPLAILGIGGGVGLLAGIAFVLFLPGYAIVAALFPGAREITWVQRVTFAIGISLALVPLAALLLSATSIGIRIEAIVGVLDLIVFGGCGIAFWRRKELPTDKRLSFFVNLPAPRWRGLSLLERYLVLGLGVVVVIASVSLAYSASRPTGARGFTEFYLLNESGAPSDYPRTLQPGTQAGVIVVIANHEGGPSNYSVEVWLATLATVRNETSGKNETVEVSDVLRDSFSLILDDGAAEEVPYSFWINQTGEYTLKFFLLLEPSPKNPYRFLRLLITVT